jgi:hypothetical protein
VREIQTALFARVAGLCPTDYLVYVETAELRSPSPLDSVRVSVAKSASVNLMDKSDGGNAPIGAVYTCNFPYESPYDSVYDLLPKVSSKLILIFFAEMCKQTIVMGDRKRIHPYSVS